MELYKIVLSFIRAGLCFTVGIAIYFRKRQEILDNIFLGVFLSYTVFFKIDAMISHFFIDTTLANLTRDFSSLAPTHRGPFLRLLDVY